TESLLQKFIEVRAPRQTPRTGKIRMRCRFAGLRRREVRLNPWSLADLADHGTHIFADAIEERFKLRLALLNLLEIRLPLTGHRGALHFRVNNFDQMNSLFRSLQAFARAHDVATLQEH